MKQSWTKYILDLCDDRRKLNEATKNHSWNERQVQADIHQKKLGYKINAIS